MKSSMNLASLCVLRARHAGCTPDWHLRGDRCRVPCTDVFTPRGAPQLTESMDARRRRLLLLAERTSWALGLAGLVVWGAFHIAVTAWTRHELDLFAALQSVALDAGKPDQSLWSPERVSAWRKTLAEPARAPLGVLRIQKIRLEVPVLPGTDERTLDRAVGHIEDTAEPGTDGNSGIAGHRDGFFRGLKDIAPGDAIELETLKGKERLSRRANVGGRSGGRLGPGPDAHTRADAGHLLSLLLRRLSSAAVYRPCRACRRQSRVLAAHH